MPKRDPIIVSMKLGYDPATLSTAGTLQCAFDGDNVIAILTDLRIQYSNIGKIQRN